MAKRKGRVECQEYKCPSIVDISTNTPSVCTHFLLSPSPLKEPTQTPQSHHSKAMARGRSPYRGRKLQPLKSCFKNGSQQEEMIEDSATISTKSEYPLELRKVIFGEVKMRSYPTVLGDNPAVSSGKFGKNDTFFSLDRQIIAHTFPSTS